MVVTHNFPQASRDNVHMLWHTDYWDGPLSGLCIWNGEKYWFHNVFEEHFEAREDHQCSQQNRYYCLFMLTPQELQEKEYWHGEFRKYVGNHSDYDEDGQRAGTIHPQSEHYKFYNRYKDHVETFKPRIDRVRAWFTDDPNIMNVDEYMMSR